MSYCGRERRLLSHHAAALLGSVGARHCVWHIFASLRCVVLPQSRLLSRLVEVANGMAFLHSKGVPGHLLDPGVALVAVVLCPAASIAAAPLRAVYLIMDHTHLFLC
jgi:hypothetical protein